MTRKTLIIAILATTYLLVAVAGVAWMLYEVSASGSALKERVAAIADKNAKVKAYTELSQLMEDTQGERTELQQYVLTESQTSRFLTDVEAFGKKLRVDRQLLLSDIERIEPAHRRLEVFFTHGSSVSEERGLRPARCHPEGASFATEGSQPR